MKELIPLFTSAVAVAGTLGGVLFTNISTTRRQVDTYKREALEEIYKTANEMYYLVVKNEIDYIILYQHYDAVYRKKLRWKLPSEPQSERAKEERRKLINERRKLININIKLKEDIMHLDSKFNMLVSLYFNDLLSPALEFSKQYQQYIEVRYSAALGHNFPKRPNSYPDREIPINSKNEFFEHVKAELKKNKFI
ncbi:hypothetical protein Q0N51_25160 [Priestia megaterium]|uniref:hypothetical protein n=1 Tax=Priestia megaterium TaxID=1404 RepID=UPI00345B3C61